MSSKTNDDTIPEAYPYFWNVLSDLSLQEWLTKYKPSMVQDDGTKPWLWVERSEPPTEDKDMASAIKEATELLKDIAGRIESIQNDDSIPIRANKKKGIKSKKELREELQSQATEKLKDISVRHGYVSGKWLIFAPSDRVDLIWSTVATSLVDGPLAATSACLTKVATCPRNETPNYQHVLCLYMPDVYDKDSVVEVMKTLLRKHGLNLNGVKSNLYTSIGLDSKHPSGIQSTVWRNNALMKDAEIKELKDEFYAELNTTKSAEAEKTAVVKTSSSATTAKVKPKLKKKVVDDDPFASDNEEAASSKEEERKEEIKVKKAHPQAKKRVAVEFTSDEDEDSEVKAEELRRREELKIKKATGKGKQAATSNLKRSKDTDEDADEDEKEKPKKKRAARK